MGVTISVGIQKGGVGKTTVTALISYILSKKYKVLAIDFDPQGNLSFGLSQKSIYEFTNNTVLEALKNKDPRPYIYKINENLHLLPADDYLSLLPRYLHREYKGDPNQLLKETIAVVKEDYDFIFIDQPPNLGDNCINGLTAADFAVAILQPEPYCYNALSRYLEFLQGVQSNTNPKLKLLGILISMLDTRAAIDSSILEKVKEDYEDIVFKSVIKRRSRIKEFSIQGIKETTKQDREAIKPYEEFVEELIKRVKIQKKSV